MNLQVAIINIRKIQINSKKEFYFEICKIQKLCATNCKSSQKLILTSKEFFSGDLMPSLNYRQNLKLIHSAKEVCQNYE